MYRGAHKNRNSGLWNDKTDLSVYLKTEDAHAQGFDTVMLKDGCGTDNPPYSQTSFDFNCARAWGFLTSCKSLAIAADIDSSGDDS